MSDEPEVGEHLAAGLRSRERVEAAVARAERRMLYVAKPECSGSVTGHVERPGEGVCFICGKRVGSSREIEWREMPPVQDDIYNQATGEPVPLLERDDYRYPSRHKRRTA